MNRATLRSKSVRAVVALAMGGILATSAGAEDYRWNVANGDYATPGSWNPQGPPTDVDRALINNGGTSNFDDVSIVSELIIGQNSGNSGTLNMTDGQLNPNRMVVGEAGTGAATVSGGTLNVGGGSLFVGGTQDGTTSGNGVLNISGSLTQVLSADDFQVGRNGTGTVNMSGGYAMAGYVVVAKYGTATWNHSGGVFEQQFGDVEIGDGGRPDQAGVSGPRQGTINLTGGVIQAAGHLAIGNRRGGGAVNVSGGALAVTRDLNGTGTIFVGRGMDWAGQAGAGGATTLRITGDDGIVVANGGFDMNSSGVASSSTLWEEITGPSHTTIRVTGDAKIANGSLKVQLSGYTPQIGDSWTLLEAGADLTADFAAIDQVATSAGYTALPHFPGSTIGSLQGTFKSTDFSMAPLSAGLQWDLSYDANKVTLSVVAGGFLPADFNNDSKVDAADLTIWKGAYGSTVAGDANGDGKTDGADFLVWQRQYSGAAAATPAVGAVPEPTSGWLLMIAGAACGALRRRR